MWLSLGCLTIVFGSTTASDVPTIADYASKALQERKQNLYQNLMRADRDESLEVTENFRWKLGTLGGSVASSFRSFGQSFLLSGPSLYLISLRENSTVSLREVLKINPYSDVLFIESVEWKNVLFLLLAFKNGMLQLFRVTEDMVLEQHKLSCCDEPETCVPRAAEFFSQDGQLYLVLISNNPGAVPMILYQWKKADLDRVDELNAQLDMNHLTSPSAMATFPTKDGTVIVIAREKTRISKGGLTVYFLQRKNLKLVQTLHADGVTGILPFLQDGQPRLLVLTEVAPSLLYAWRGKLLSSESQVSSVSNIRTASVSYVNGTTFLLLLDWNDVRLFTPAGHVLNSVATFDFPAKVDSATIHENKEGVFLVAITKENDGTLSPIVLKLHLSFANKNDKLTLPRDDLIDCIRTMESTLATRKEILNKLVAARPKLLLRHQPGKLSGKLVVNSPNKVVVRKDTQTSIVINPQDYNFTATPSQLKAEIISKLATAQKLRAALPGLAKKQDSLTYQGPLQLASLKVASAFIDTPVVNTLNKRIFAPDNILMYSKNQTLTGRISANEIKIDRAFVKSLSGMKIEDLLLNSGTQQTLNVKEVPAITAGSVNVMSAKINEIALSQLVTKSLPKGSVIRGVKTAPSFVANDLLVGLYNKVDLSSWWNSIRPVDGGKPNVNIASDLIVKNLTVNFLNDVNLKNLLASLFLVGNKQEILGTVTFKKAPTIANLVTQNVKGGLSSNLMTLNSDQVLYGPVSVGALSAPQIVTNSVNKLNLETDVARTDSPNAFGYVAFQNLILKELQLPLSTYINGQLIPPYFLEERRQVFKRRVRIRGTLNVVDIVPQGKVILQDQQVSLTDFPSIYWTKSTPQTIPLPVSAKSSIVKSLSVKTVNGLPTDNFLHCNTLQSLSANWLLPSAVVVGDVTHLPGSQPPLLNPRSLYDSVVLTSGNYTIEGRKVFTGGIRVGHLRTNSVDDIDPKNVVLKSSSTLPGSNVWDRIQIKKDLVVEANLTPSKVNNIDLCAKIAKAVRTDESAKINSMQMNTVIAGDMGLKVLNGVPLQKRFPRRAEMPRLRRLLVKGTVTVPEIQYVTIVNNVKLADFLPFVVNKRTGAVIEGKKTFAAQVTLQESLFTSSVNGVNLNNFVSNLLSKTRPQNVTAMYTMESADAKRLAAWEVNNVDVGKLLTTDVLDTQLIHGNLRFLAGLRVGDLLSKSLLNKCDIKTVIKALTKLEGGRWSTLEIDGDLSWTVPRKPTSLADRGLGYLIDSAVTKNGNNLIVGEVTFGAPVTVRDIESERSIDDVAMDFIVKDSLLKVSPVDQVIYSPIKLLNNTQASTLIVSGNIDVKTVNDLDILTLNNSIVRKSRSDSTVRGRKIFLKGIKTTVATCDDHINDVIVSSIVAYDNPRLPPVEMNSTMDIAGNLTFGTFNGLDIDRFLEERVTLDTPQIISGAITFVDDLSIKDQTIVSNINNVDVSTVVTTDHPQTQIIVGQKTFIQDLIVEGPINLSLLNGLDFSETVHGALLKDYPVEGARIAGSVTFAAPVTVDSDLFVDGAVNGLTLNELQRRLKTVAIRYPIAVREKLLRQVRVGKDLLSARRKPEEVLYLDSVKNLDIRVSNTSRAVARQYLDHVLLDVYGSELRDCGLPEDCPCPVQMSLDLNESGGNLVAGTWTKILDRTFEFNVSNSVIKVISNTVSRNSKCRVRPEDRALEYTNVTWMRPSLGPEGLSAYVSTDSGFRGYVSDVALLQYRDLIYVIVGLSYDPVYDTTNLNSKMLLLDYGNSRIEVAEEIPTFGVSALNVFTMASVPYLVVGNSYDSDKRSSEVPLYIYRFNTSTYKLDAVRKIPTVGVVAVASLVEGGDSIIVVAQAQTNAPVLVFKYDSMYDTFKVAQQLTNIALPTGLGTFRLSDGFVGLSTADDKFRLYKFCHVQGLKLVQEYRKNGVRGFARFEFAKTYLFLTSSEESSLVELVVQGR